MNASSRLSRIGLFYTGLFVIAALWASAQQRNLFVETGTPAATLLWHAALGLAVGLVLAKGSQRLAMHYAWARRLERALAESIGPFTAGEAFLVAALSALGEEALFRGAMQPAIGLVPTALAFGLLHVGPGRVFLPWTGMAIAVGFVFGGLVLLTGDLLVPVIAHATINFINLRHMSRQMNQGAHVEPPPFDPNLP